MSKFDENFIQYNEEKVKTETKNLTLYFLTHITLYIVLLFFAIFFIWYTVFISTHSFYVVEGPSMMSTLNSKITEEQLWQEGVEKISYDAVYVDRSTKASVFDVVVVKRPNKSVIKRMLAQEGDYITIAQTKAESGEDRLAFYRIPKGMDLETFTDEDAFVDEESGVNGYKIRGYADWFAHSAKTDSLLAEGQKNSHVYCSQFYENFLKPFFERTYLSQAELESLKDSFFVSKEGLVYVKVPAGKFFCMGDNRAHSSDCRIYGFYNTSAIVGRSEFIVYDYNFGNRILEVIKFYFKEAQEFFAR